MLKSLDVSDTIPYFRDTPRSIAIMHEDGVSQESRLGSVTEVRSNKRKRSFASTCSLICPDSIPNGGSSTSESGSQIPLSEPSSSSIDVSSSQTKSDSAEQPMRPAVPDAPRRNNIVDIPGNRGGKKVYLSTLGVAIYAPNFLGVLTVDHIFHPSMASTNTWDSQTEEDAPEAFHTSGSHSDSSEQQDKLELRLEDTDEYDFNDITWQPDSAIVEDTRASATETVSINSYHEGNGDVVMANWQRVLPKAPLDDKTPYLDWALIRPMVDIGTHPLPNILYPDGLDQKPVDITEAFKESPAHEAEIFMVSGIRGILKGRILASYSVLGPTTSYEACETWIVILDSDSGTADTLLEGECGSLVVDQKSSEIYGHAVACGPLGQIYVSPLKHVLGQIKMCFDNQEVQLTQQRRHPVRPNPVELATHDSSDLKAGGVPEDNIDDLPSLEKEAKIYNASITVQPKAEFAHASCKKQSIPGSYIRATTMRSNNLPGADDGFVVIQWPSGLVRNNCDNTSTSQTACRIVDEEQAMKIGMNVDVVFGKDCTYELEHQKYGARLGHRLSRNSADVSGESPQTPILPVGSSSLERKPGNSIFDFELVDRPFLQSPNKRSRPDK